MEVEKYQVLVRFSREGMLCLVSGMSATKMCSFCDHASVSRRVMMVCIHSALLVTSFIRVWLAASSGNFRALAPSAPAEGVRSRLRIARAGGENVRAKRLNSAGDAW